VGRKILTGLVLQDRKGASYEEDHCIGDGGNSADIRFGSGELRRLP
jgi:hypothetical protein